MPSAATPATRSTGRRLATGDARGADAWRSAARLQQDGLGGVPADAHAVARRERRITRRPLDQQQRAPAELDAVMRQAADKAPRRDLAAERGLSDAAPGAERE